MKKLPLRFVYPIVLVMILDFTFTVIGQPESYWNNFANVDEGSPLGFTLMTMNPILFLVFCVIYLFAAIVLVRRLPLFFGATVGLSLFLGHAWGSSTWVYHLFGETGVFTGRYSEWFMVVGYFVLVSLASVLLVTREERWRLN